MNKENMASFLEHVEKDLQKDELAILISNALGSENPVLIEFAILCDNTSLSSYHRIRAISLAIENNYKRLVEVCLDYGIIPCNDDLCSACKNNYDDIVKLLVDSNIDINANGGKAIITALDEHAVESAKILIEAGVDLRFDNYLPLRMAAQEDLDDLFALMMEKLKEIK